MPLPPEIASKDHVLQIVSSVPNLSSSLSAPSLVGVSAPSFFLKMGTWLKCVIWGSHEGVSCSVLVDPADVSRVSIRFLRASGLRWQNWLTEKRHGLVIFCGFLQSWLDLTVSQASKFDITLGLDWLRECNPSFSSTD